MTKIKWGAEIPCNDRPDWLKDDDVCKIFYCNVWCGEDSNGRLPRDWAWSKDVTAIKLPADHPYYAPTVYGGAHGPIISAIFTLEAAGYTVTKPEPYEALHNALLDMIDGDDFCFDRDYVVKRLRRAIPDPASIDVAALAKGE